MGLLAFASALVVTTAGVAAAVDAVPLPMKGPPGADVGVNVTNCPAGTTETIAIRFRVAGGAALPFDPAEPGLVVVPATQPTVVVPFRVPIDTNPGAYAFDVFCLGAGNTVVDGPATVPFEVALLPVSVTPNQGPLGTHITVSGSGCPTGVTDVVAVRIEGASDQVAPWDPAAPDAFRFSAPPAADGSFSIAFAVPSDLPLGENSVQVFCISEGGSNLAGPGFGLFIVTESTVATSPLPRTGGNSAAPDRRRRGAALRRGAVRARDAVPPVRRFCSGIGASEVSDIRGRGRCVPHLSDRSVIYVTRPAVHTPIGSYGVRGRLAVSVTSRVVSAIAARAHQGARVTIDSWAHGLALGPRRGTPQGNAVS